MINYTLINVSNQHKIAFAKVDYNKESELIELLNSKEINLNQLKSFTNNKRKIEWMTIRYLLLQVHSVNDDINYDTHGKPHFAKSKSHLSISHSHEMVAVSIDENKASGIDIQLISKKVTHIKHKFLNETELSEVIADPIHLTIFWSCKEALFKVYGKKDAYLKENMSVSEINFDGTEGNAKGFIRINGFQSEHKLRIILLEDYVLAYVVNS